MAVNRRLIFWLIKAYVKKWRKTIAVFFVLGLAFFFLLNFFVSTLIAKIPLIEKETIGVVGAYTVDTLPDFVLKEISRGLTKVSDNGVVSPDLASSWEIKNSGKEYVFHLRKGVKFADGTELSSKEIQFSFSDVIIKRPNDLTITFDLREPYSPFLVTMSRPVFRKGLIGIGEYQIKDIELNGNFVTTLTLAGIKQHLRVKVYQFYPTQEALRLAFVLGNVSQIAGITDLTFKGISLASFPNANISKATSYNQLVTLFYNTQDKNLSDKKMRDALSYALPNQFPEGTKAQSPISPKSWAYQSSFQRLQDLDHSRLLLKDITDSGKNQLPKLTISTLAQYKDVAENIKSSWAKIGIKATVKTVVEIPSSFEIFLGDFNVPKDPDQYALWHSDQQNNITGYKSLRIDKLLEDGRKTENISDRLKIYSDFQKYLMDDQPASFLYFPTMYTVTRK